MPFPVIEDEQGTGVYAQWRPDGTLALLQYRVRGRVLKDAGEPRELRFVGDERVEAPGGESWSKGGAWDSYAAAFESYEGTTVDLMTWVTRQVEAFSRPTRAEVSWARRRRWALSVFAAVALAAAGWRWLVPRLDPGAAADLVIGGAFFCVVLPLVALLPNTRPVWVRGHRVEVHRGD